MTVSLVGNLDWGWFLSFHLSCEPSLDGLLLLGSPYRSTGTWKQAASLNPIDVVTFRASYFHTGLHVAPMSYGGGTGGEE